MLHARPKPVTETKKIASTSASERPARVSERHRACSARSSATSIQASFALPQVVKLSYSSMDNARCLPSTPTRVKKRSISFGFSSRPAQCRLSAAAICS